MGGKQLAKKERPKRIKKPTKNFFTLQVDVDYLNKRRERDYSYYYPLTLRRFY